MRSFVLVAVVVCATLALVAEASRLSNWREWQAYKQKYGKVYESPEEDARRFGLFLRSKARLSALRGAQESHKRGLNHLSDWSEEEYQRMSAGFRLPASVLLSEEEQEQNDEAAERFLAQILADDAKPVPESVDWRKVPGRVSPVKDQDFCSSCWAFATTGLLEGQQQVVGAARRNGTSLAPGELTPLSEQELVDCSRSDFGCAGGLMGLALGDLAKLGGIESERDYPYEDSMGQTRPCRFVRAKSVMSELGPVYLPPLAEDKLKVVVARYGPVAVALDARDLSNYASGVYQGGPACSGAQSSLTHAVLIVGYGTDPQAGDFWLVKNSFSAKWGEAGYFRITRGKNTCAIAQYAVIARL